MLLKTWWSQQKMDSTSPGWEDVNDKVWFLEVPLG